MQSEKYFTNHPLLSMSTRCLLWAIAAFRRCAFQASRAKGTAARTSLTSATPGILSSIRPIHFVRSAVAAHVYCVVRCTPSTARPEGSAFLAKLSSQAMAVGVLQAMLGPLGTHAAAASPGK